jgi:hypothetical protein
MNRRDGGAQRYRFAPATDMGRAASQMLEYIP